MPALDARIEYQVGPERVSITPAPNWIPKDLVTQVFDRAGLTSQESLLDDTLTERVAAAFYTHPWIEAVHAVRKGLPAGLQVDVTYRTPVALVVGVDGYYPVDRNGVLLPPTDFRAADIDRYAVVEHVASVPLGKVGEKWGDPSVMGAAQLASVLRQPCGPEGTWWERFELQSIVAPSRVALEQEADELDFVLRTQGGSQIRWGRSPQTTHPAELTVAQKLQRLQEYRTDYGGFDDAHGPWEIDIRPWHGIGRRRLAQGAPPDRL
jgi:hypothetical protein